MKKSIAASFLAALHIDCYSLNESLPPENSVFEFNKPVKGLPARIIFGGTFYTAYNRGRFSVDDTEERI